MLVFIVSYQDPTFTRKFWQDIFKLQDIQLKMSTTYYPKIYGQSEVVKKFIETYLRRFSFEKPYQWTQWLPLTKWWYNTSYYGATKMTPYEEVYSKKQF
jgi:hypothetical protein